MPSAWTTATSVAAMACGGRGRGIKPLAFGQYGEMVLGWLVSKRPSLPCMAHGETRDEGRTTDEMADRYLIENREAAVGRDAGCRHSTCGSAGKLRSGGPKETQVLHEASAGGGLSRRSDASGSSGRGFTKAAGLLGTAATW
jgi:hypothetical protein